MKITMTLLFLAAVLVTLFVVVGGTFMMISSGKVEPFRDARGNELEGSIAEKIKVEINGAQNGFIIRGRDLDNPVLLLVSSGPGTSDYFLNQEYPNMNLEDYYTVCYWDYRGMCMVYDKNIDPATITTRQIMEDTKAVTEYLLDRFGKEKIYIMGFSGGTHIALQAVSEFPEYYEAYFGMAQVVTNTEDCDTCMYGFMKQVFEERGDQKRLRKLESVVEHRPDGKVKCNSWVDYVYLVHEAGGGTIKDKTEFQGIIVPILKAHCYTMREKLDYIRGMKMYRTTPFYQEVMGRDYRELVTEVEVPVYFISGESDYNSPWPLVEEYCGLIEAPQKGFLKVPDAAHSPLWENPEAVVDFMKDVRRENGD